MPDGVRKGRGTILYLPRPRWPPALPSPRSMLVIVSGSGRAPGIGPWDRVDVIQVLESYRSQRAPRTARIQTTARTWGEVWHVEGVARTLRNELMTQRDTDSYASPTGCTAIRAEQPTALTVAADAEGDVDRAHTSTDRACPRLPEGEGAKARSCRGTPAYPRARCAPVLPLPTLVQHRVNPSGVQVAMLWGR